MKSGAELALSRLIQARSRGTILRRANAHRTPVTVEQVRRELVPDRHGVLAYLPAFDRTHLFMLDDDTLTRIDLGPEHHLQRRIEESHPVMFARRASRPENGNDDRKLRALAKILFPAEVEKKILSWKGLVVVGNDLLGRVPFAFLPACGYERMGFEIPISYLPSLPLGLYLKQRSESLRADPPLDLVLIAAPKLSLQTRERWEIQELPWREAAAKAWRRSYEPERLHVANGGNATVLAALDPELLSKTQSIQFLTHAVRDSSLERPTVLLMSPANPEDSGVLSCDDVEATETAPPLVMITACGSGRGPIRRGDDETGHLGGAWLAAGASTVLISETDLEYETTVQLSARFHDHLKRGGVSPAEALRLARRTLLKQGLCKTAFEPGWVRVLGLGHEPLFPAPAPFERGLEVEFVGAPELGAPKGFPWLWGAFATGGLALLALLASFLLGRRR